MTIQDAELKFSLYIKTVMMSKLKLSVISLLQCTKEINIFCQTLKKKHIFGKVTNRSLDYLCEMIDEAPPAKEISVKVECVEEVEMEVIGDDQAEIINCVDGGDDEDYDAGNYTCQWQMGRFTQSGPQGMAFTLTFVDNLKYLKHIQLMHSQAFVAHFITIERNLWSTVDSIWSMTREHKIIARGSGALDLVAVSVLNIN